MQNATTCKSFFIENFISYECYELMNDNKIIYVKNTLSIYIAHVPIPQK